MKRSVKAIDIVTVHSTRMHRDTMFLEVHRQVFKVAYECPNETNLKRGVPLNITPPLMLVLASILSGVHFSIYITVILYDN